MSAIALNLGLHNGHVHTTAGPCLGHAVWLPPEASHIGDERLAATGFENPAAHIGNDALEQFVTFMEQIGPAHERPVPEPHWYLLVLGVDPPYQGRG